MISDFQLKWGSFVYYIMKHWMVFKFWFLVSLWYCSSGRSKWISQFPTRFPLLDIGWEGLVCLTITPTWLPLILCDGDFVIAGCWWKSPLSNRLPWTPSCWAGKGVSCYYWVEVEVQASHVVSTNYIEKKCSLLLGRGQKSSLSTQPCLTPRGEGKCWGPSAQPGYSLSLHSEFDPDCQECSLCFLWCLPGI